MLLGGNMLVKCKTYRKPAHGHKCGIFCQGPCDCDKKGNLRVRVENQEIINEFKKRSSCQHCQAREANPQICYSCIWIHINSIEHSKNNFMGGKI